MTYKLYVYTKARFGPLPTEDALVVKIKEYGLLPYLIKQEQRFQDSATLPCANLEKKYSIYTFRFTVKQKTSILEKLLYLKTDGDLAIQFMLLTKPIKK